MKKKLPPARTPPPRFHSDNEAADSFQTHSVADVWDRLPETRAAKPSKALEWSIRERHAAAKSPISIRLGLDQIAAAAKSVGYRTQLRMWIAEGIRREAKRARFRRRSVTPSDSFRAPNRTKGLFRHADDG